MRPKQTLGQATGNGVGQVVSLVCLINNQPIILLSISTRPAKTQCQRLPRLQAGQRAGDVPSRAGPSWGRAGHATRWAGCLRPCPCLCLCLCPQPSSATVRTRNTAQRRNKFSMQRQKIQANAHTKGPRLRTPWTWSQCWSRRRCWSQSRSLFSLSKEFAKDPLP